jgi:hypothetical protein
MISHLWADTYDRKLTDIFRSRVSGQSHRRQLQAKLTGQEEQVLANRPTDNPEATMPTCVVWLRH